MTKDEVKRKLAAGGRTMMTVEQLNQLHTIDRQIRAEADVLEDLSFAAHVIGLDVLSDQLGASSRRLRARADLLRTTTGQIVHSIQKWDRQSTLNVVAAALAVATEGVKHEN